MKKTTVIGKEIKHVSQLPIHLQNNGDWITDAIEKQKKKQSEIVSLKSHKVRLLNDLYEHSMAE